MTTSLTALADRVASEPLPDEIAAVQRSIDWIDTRTGDLPVRLRQQRILLLALAEPFDAEAVMSASRAPGISTGNILAEISFRLNAASRGVDALELLRLSEQSDVEPNLLAQFAVSIADAGSADDAQRLLRLTPTAADRANALVALGVRPGGAPLTESADQLGSELLALIASRMQTLERDQAALAVLGQAQSLNPSDPVLANNFAYSLAEAGLDLQRAAMLAEQALETEPLSASFTDTLGWIRYRQGRFNEALALLMRAAELGGPSVETSRQLGDTLWRLGRETEAIVRWEEGSSIVAESIEQARQAGVPEGGLRALQRRAEDLADRLTAAARGEPPPLPEAPIDR